MSHVMRGGLVAFFCVLAGLTHANTLDRAVKAAGARDWVTVDALRGSIQNQAAREVVDWLRLRGRQGTWAECERFLARNADWPGLPLLRSRCEAAIPRGSEPSRVLAYFADHLPRTGTGSLRLAEALYRSGQGDQGDAELRRGWTSLPMSDAEHAAFVGRNGEVIKNFHTKRLDQMLWDGHDVSARRMFPLVDDGWKKLAAARMALRARKGDVDGLIAAIPERLTDDPGLAFERFLWRDLEGLDERAVELLLERSSSADSLGKPSEWSNRRRVLARQVMREGKAGLAYLLASGHHLTSGSAYADLEWLSGYIALRKLNAPAEALIHFSKFRAAVASPISLGRAGFWLGETYTALNSPQEAASAYRFGAQYQSSFYGQLAAERAGLPADPAMTGRESFPDWRGAAFTKSSVFEAAMQLHEAGQRNLAERFLVHLAETQDRTSLGQMADLALDLDEPHIALMISKQAAQQGHELYKGYFPVTTPAGMQLPVDDVFALSIARRESEFDPVVVSPAGARGLMQLMPGTARDVARQLGVSYSAPRLLSDPQYNARLGSTYLADMSARYSGNPVLMSVAYNAGPTRADRWQRNYGNPRAGSVDVIDWIEGIPFRETRNYVMRVTESFAPYRARLSGQTEPPKLTEVLKR